MTDYSWVKKVMTIETHIGHDEDDRAMAEQKVNEMLTQGWHLLRIINDRKICLPEREVTTESFYILGYGERS